MLLASHRALAANQRQKRFDEPAKFLPVAFVWFTITSLYLIYLVFHCLPMLQGDVPADHRDDDRRSRGVFETIAFHIITVLLLTCYVRSILEHPGEVPDDDPHWRYQGGGRDDGKILQDLNLMETKKGGERRHCKWCGKYKPDRCHHCRVCRTCILKMDHHCPWIYNCVGFHNYKFFFLLLFYCVLDLQLMMWTMFESVVRSWEHETSFTTMFFVLFGETLSVFLGVLLTAFFSFHIWLMFKAMTTIEFCEKKMPKKPVPEGHPDPANQVSIYSRGCWGNIQTVLGKNILIWLLPISAHDKYDNGLQFGEATPMARDYEAGRGVGRKPKGHQKTQRIGSSRQMQYGATEGMPFFS